MPLSHLNNEDMSFIGLYVDDERSLPDDLCEAGWTQSKTFHEALVKLELIEFESLSLDHDLGCFYGYTELTGYHIVLWLVQRKQDGLYVPPDIRLHTANPVGRDNMQATIDRYLTD